MGIETNLNQSPYFDDFDETKNFHRILFRPGYAVQARELTQMQTILQNQIERLSDEILVDGTIVTGIGIRTDNRLSYVKLRDKDANNRVLLLGDFFRAGVVANAIVSGATSGMTAQLIDVKEGSESAAPNYLTLMVKYTNSGANNTTKTFLDNEVLLVRRASNNQFLVAANSITSDSTGYGFGAFVSEGIIYHKGAFVRVPQQRITVDKYSTFPDKKLGFETRESIIDSNQDSSLLDNATGSTNFSAPGANRLKLNPILAVRELSANTANTVTFFTIARIQEGNIITRNKDTVYADIGEFIANKFFETNGNYAIEPFNIRIREHLRNQTNLGKYNSSVGGSANKLIAEVERGVGYVNGNRISIENTIPVEVDKATDFEIKSSRVIGHTIGNYVYAKEVAGLWDFDTYKTVSLYNSVQKAITDKNLSAQGARGTAIGTARVRGIELHSGTSGTALAQFRIYLFDVQMNSGRSFSEVRGLFISNGTGSGQNSLADIVLESSGIAKLQEPSLNRLIFPFTQRGTRKLRNSANNSATQFVYKQKQDVNFTSKTASFGLDTIETGGNEAFNDTGTLSNNDERNFIFVTKTSTSTDPHTGKIDRYSGNTVFGSGTNFTTTYKVGDFIRIVHGANTFTERITAISSATQLSVANNMGVTAAGKSLPHRTTYPVGYIFDLSTNGSISSTTTDCTVDLGIANLASSFTITAHYDVLRSSAIQTAKVVNKDKFIKINTGSHSASKNGPWSLGVSDAFKIVAVYKGSNTSPTESDIDVTNEFELDDGQKDSLYDTAYLRKKSTSSLNLTNCGLLVKFHYFTRDYSSGLGFFSVDSYPIDDASSANTNAITTQEIPIFDSPTSGISYDLRDAVDYRPSKTNTVTPSATVGSAPSNPTASSTFDISTARAYVPVPDENFQADVQFYLPRKDRVVLTKEGLIEVIKGVSNKLPRTPDEKFGTMTLGILDIPVYPSLSPYVARQFGRTDYQVVLSLENNRRYTMQDLRSIEQRVKNLEYYSSLNALEVSAKNKQLFNDSGVDRFKNGFLVDNFDGHNIADTKNKAYRAAIDRYTTTLRPSYNENVISMKQAATPSSSNMRKTGDLLTLNYTDIVFLDQPLASRQRRCVQEVTFNWRGEIILTPSMDNTPDITTLPDIQVDFDGMYNAIEFIARETGVTGIDWGNWRTTNVTSATNTDTDFRVSGFVETTTVRSTTVTTEDLIREGLQTTISPSTETFSFGPFVENVAVRDFMRSRLVLFTGYRMKPSTRVFPYFDGELVSEYCTPANSTYANTASEGSSLVTDSFGNVFGVFRIPNDDKLKFRVGTRKFELKDIANTQTQSALLTTSAHADYTSIQLDVTQRGASLNITVPQFSSTQLVDTDVQTRVTTSTSVSVVDNTPPPPAPPPQEIWWGGDGGGDGGGDPICQTFTCVTGRDRNGTFITKIDLFFAKKSDTLPVTMQIREVENGFPTKVIVPYGSKTLQASQVTANSTVATNATTFTFDSPVFLQSNKTYAICILPAGDNQDYVLWTAELGGIDVDRNTLIDKQPAAGVLFTSSNNETWAQIQSEDMKFRIWRANFTTSTGTVYIENDDIDFFSIDNRTGTFNIGEKVVAESVLRFSNNAAVPVGTVLKSRAAATGSLASNPNFANGVVRQVVGYSSGIVTVKVDGFGAFPTSTASNTHNLYSGSNTWIGNTTAFTANTSQGFISFLDTDRNRIFIDRSTGSFANGYIRGQVSGATARVVTVDNIGVNAFVPKIPQISYGNTQITWSVRTTSTGGIIDTNYEPVQISIDNEIIGAEKRVYGKTNEAALTPVAGSRKSFVLRGTLSTTDTFLSPVIDSSRFNTILLKNNINSDVTNEHLDAGNAQARYISKRVVLADGQEAEDLIVYLTAYKPSGTNINVYARVHNPEDPQAFNEKDFTPLRQVTTSNTFSDSVNRSDFKEFEYTFSANTNGQNFLVAANSHAYLNSGNNGVIAYRSDDGSIYHTYKTFAIKIVMTSSSGTSIIPLVRDMRAIALQK
jgi:hypothetical protein